MKFLLTRCNPWLEMKPEGAMLSYSFCVSSRVDILIRLKILNFIWSGFAWKIIQLDG